MNLLNIDNQIEDFSRRIIETLKLQKCKQGMLASQKKLCSWVRQQSVRLKKQQEEAEKKKPGFAGRIAQKLFKKETHAQKDPIQIDLNLLSDYVKKGVIPKGFTFGSKNIPDQIIGIVNELKGKKFQSYYGYVKGPFMSDVFILKKQDFNSVVESVQINQLKFLMIQEKVAHRYQRNLVQQIFGRVFRSRGALSLVLKIEVNFDPLEPPFNIFCYIQDRKLKDEIQWKPLSQLQKNFNKLQIRAKNKTLQVSQINMLQIFLSQILVLPLQSLVSDFIVWIKQIDAQLVKCNQQTQQQIIKETSLKQHPSLRNPLLFFRQYLNQHSIKIADAKKVTIHTQLYASFYRCLEIVVDLILTDFETQANDIQINSSICFNEQVFSALWITFHKINLLSGWMKQVIEPIKNTITISQIISHFCPIFNEISIMDTDNFQNYRQFFLNLQMESHLATIVKKTSLQKYKDMYVQVGQAVINKKLFSTADIYNQIFRPILHEANLLYSDPVQVAYIFNFCCKFLFHFKPIKEQIDEKWKDPILWERCIKVMQKDELIFIDIGFDFMAYACGIDSFSLDPKSFQRVKYTVESPACLAGVYRFVSFINAEYQNNSNYILSSLLQKAFKHKKFKICTILLEKKVQIRDFRQIIRSQQLQDSMTEQTKESILKTIQMQSPQMHRLYKWQQLMIVHLKKQEQGSAEINTYEFGKIYLPKNILDLKIKNGKVVNTLSRKDCRFNSRRQIAYVDLGKGLSFYLQSNEFPLMPYFYRIFLTKMGAQELMFNFATFFYENQLIHISQSLPNGLNLKKGLLTYTQQQLISMTDIQLVSQAIILSMIVLPIQINLQDMFIAPLSWQYGQIFIVDWYKFYNKNFMCRYGGKAALNTKNSFFLMEIMQKAVHPNIIKKYGSIDVMKICEVIFLQCKSLSQSLHDFYKQHQNTKQPTKQLLAMIFESGFIFNLAERLFKIKRAFNTNSAYFQKSISYYKVLEILHSETSYYYQEVYSTSVNLRERQLLLSDQNWKRSFLHANIIEFFGGFRKLQEVQNKFPQHYYRFCFQGPTQSLADATTYIKKFKAFSGEVPETFQNYNNEFFEYVMRNIDLRDYGPNQRQKFMNLIKNKSTQYLDSGDQKVLPLSFIGLKSIQFLKQTYLDHFSFERVQQLIIQSCWLGAYDIKSFPNTLKNVLYLQLKDVRGVQYMGENTIYGNPIQIRHLKTLSIIQCHQLISIDLKCDILECLQLRNNSQLESVYIYSLNFKNIYIYNNHKLNIQNIGIYILKGINVLLCRSSCRGDLTQLYSKSYDIYVNNILKHLLISFFVKKNRYLMLLTLCKMRQMNQQLFTRAGISTLRPISSILGRFNTEVQDNLLAEIFRLYFSNPHLHEVVIGQYLIQLNSVRDDLTIPRLFKVITQGLVQVGNIKPFQSLRFQNSQIIFNNLQKVQMKTLIDLLKTQKYFTLTFDHLNSNPILNSKQIQLIRYLSMQKDSIQKLTLIFKQSKISIQFLTQIFKDTLTLQQMKKQQQQMFKTQLKSRMSRMISKRSLNQQYPRHMKINRITLQNCFIQDPLYNEQTHQHQRQRMQQRQQQIKQKQKQKQKQKHLYQSSGLIQIQQSNTNTISLRTQSFKYQNKVIKNRLMQFGSVKQLRLTNCTLQSFQILQRMPNLVLIGLYKCQILGLGSYQQQMNNFFHIIKHKQLHTLDLQYFFNNSPQSQKSFNKFCQIIKYIQTLKILRLNCNTLTFDSLKKLDNTLNYTTIQELQLDNLVLIDKTNNLKSSYTQLRIQYMNQLRQKRQQCNSAYLKNIFKDTKYLKSLTIQLKSLKYLQQFIKSISQNNSLIYLRILTNYQISSTLLTPLNQNTTLNHISSNMQLPVWLLNYISSNRIKDKKANVYQSDGTDDSVLNALNNTLMSGKGYDYYRMGLSLDGGGMRGMLLATQLDYLAKQVGYPLHKIFDCIGGTSIGGILALLSTGTYDGYNPVATSEQLMGLFTKFGKDIFKKSQFRQFRNLFDTKYSAASFQQVLKNYFKDTKLSNCLQQTSVIVTAVNRVDNKDYIFRSMQSLLNRQRDFYMRDVARATAAAPTYFPSAQIKNVNATLKLSLLDGGVGMNNPSKLVIDQVMKLSANSTAFDNYFLLSLGTGRLPNQTIPQSAGLKDISPIIDSFAQSSNYFLQRDLATNYKGHFYRVSPSINVSDKRNAQLDNTSDQIIEVYRQTGLAASKKYFNNTVIFGKYRNMNLIEWLRENTARKFDI